MSYWSLLPAAPLVLAMGASCLRKAQRERSSVQLRERLGVPPAMWAAIGVLEGSAVAGLLVGLARPAVGCAAASGVALLMAGALLAHLRAGLTGRELLPPAVLLVVAVLAGGTFAVAA